MARLFARLLTRLRPARVDTADPSQPLYLDWAARETPSIALAGAAREALRMVDVFEAMLRGALDSLDRGDRKRVTETALMDNLLDSLDTAIKEYLTSLDTDVLDDSDHRRLSEILAFTTNLEHAGDNASIPASILSVLTCACAIALTCKGLATVTRAT
jgi:phosphate:Na+ symporter